jgi:hypothetical protein
MEGQDQLVYQEVQSRGTGGARHVQVSARASLLTSPAWIGGRWLGPVLEQEAISGHWQPGSMVSGTAQGVSGSPGSSSVFQSRHQTILRFETGK